MTQSHSLQAMVVGAGWAGEGHTLALREAGIDVTVMVGRSVEPAKKRAAELGIPNVRFQYQEALQEFRPDIVAIGTPAKPHCEIALAAAEMGCHILCDKPLGLNALEAKQMLDAVERAGVKHAYAATHRYNPVIMYARELIANQTIGQVREITSNMEFHVDSKQPSTWVHHLDQGGGMLFNTFPHSLAQILFACQAEVTGASGEALRTMGRVAKGFDVHDFRQYFFGNMDTSSATEWEEADADASYIAILSLKMPDGSPVDCLVRGTVFGIGSPNHNMTLFGTKGTLKLDWSNTIKRFDLEKNAWEEIEVPKTFYDALGVGKDPVQQYWNQLAREFVSDIRGEGYKGYPSFYDGWVTNRVIDIIRHGQKVQL